MSKGGAQRMREAHEHARMTKALEEAERIAERARYDDGGGPSPMAFAVTAYGMLRTAGNSPIEITQIFRDMPRLLHETPEEGLNVPLADMERSARELGVTIKGVCGEGVGFVLVLYNYGAGAGGNMTFISTGQRSDTIKMLRDLIGKIEAEQAQVS